MKLALPPLICAAALAMVLPAHGQGDWYSFVPDPVARRGSATYYQDCIDYQWMHPLPNGQIVPLAIQVDWAPGWSLATVEAHYARLTHTLHGSQEDNNINEFYVNDPMRPAVQSIAVSLRQVAQQFQLTDVDVALSFVQNLGSASMNNYQSYAAETALTAYGDCSDKSVLFAAILDIWSYDCIFLSLPGHVAVGIYGPSDVPGFGYVAPERLGRRYSYCETSAPGWRVGDAPAEYQRVGTYLFDVGW